MGLLEEISFFKNLDVGFFYPIILTFMNSPITLFEILPFIFLLSTQFLFFDIINNRELSLLKRNSLNNFAIVKNLFFLGILIGVFNILIFYNLSAILKFNYSNIKNNFSNDNKYLAMVTDSGLWIKDNVDGRNYIIKSKNINQNFLNNNIINEFDKNFELIRIIKANKIDVKSYNWIIYDPEIIINNNKDTSVNKVNLMMNFNMEKINSFFTEISALDIIRLINSKKDYERLGYSTDEINIYILKLLTMPIYYGVLIVLASILMFNTTLKDSFIKNLFIGIMISVIIYYITFIFNAMGNNGKISIQMSVFFPIIILTILSIIGLIRINEK